MEEKQKRKFVANFDKLLLKKLASVIVALIPAFFIYQMMAAINRSLIQKIRVSEACFYLVPENGLRDIGIIIVVGLIFALVVVAIQRLLNKKNLIKKKERLKLILIGVGIMAGLGFNFISNRDYVCLRENGIVDQSIWGSRGIFDWMDVSYVQTDCQYGSGGKYRSGNYWIELAFVMKSGQRIEIWRDNLKTLGYTREGAYELKKIYSVAKNKNIPIIRGNLSPACHDKFLDFALIGSPKLYDEPEIWELVKEVFVEKSNVRS